MQHIQVQHFRSIDLNLDRVREVWTELGNPMGGFNIVVAGTNGKGSSVNMLEQIYLETGKSVGAYTSPHLVRFNERIRVNGEEASDQEICTAFVEIEEIRKEIPLTYFEYGTLCALHIFELRSVDIALLEVGMGGRLDAVNIIDGDIALITTIGLDHTQWLGDDRETIAFEKAGVIRQNGRVVCSDIDIPAVIRGVCEEKCATLISANQDYSCSLDDDVVTWQSEHESIPKQWKNIINLELPLHGDHQMINFGGVVAVCAMSSLDTGVTVQHLHSGIQKSSLRGRLQVIQQKPLVIADVAHNQDSAIQLSRYLSDQDEDYGKTLAVFGVLADKSLLNLISPLTEQIDKWFLATLKGDRGQSSELLADKLREIIPRACWTTWNSPIEAYNAAISDAETTDRVVIFGSFHTVGDIIEILEDPA